MMTTNMNVRKFTNSFPFFITIFKSWTGGHCPANCAAFLFQIFAFLINNLDICYYLMYHSEINS